MKTLTLSALTFVAFLAVFLAVSASVFLIAGMAIYVLGRRLFGFSRPVAA